MFAQTGEPFTANTEDECLEAAQVWYDAIDPEEELNTNYVAGINSSTMSRRFSAIESFGEIIDAISAMDYPDCIEDARLTYIRGLGWLKNALAAQLDNDGATLVYAMMHGFQYVGFSRGYLHSLGVEGIELIPESGDFIFK